MKRERHLSRRVIVADGNDSAEYSLSVVDLIYSGGAITHIHVSPFCEEQSGVEYHDNPIILRHQGDVWVFEEEGK